MAVSNTEELPIALQADLDEIPSLPAVVSSCLNELHDPDSNAQRVADLMLADVGLTARALRLVNSSFFALRCEIRSLAHAIALLGSARLEEIILSVVLPGLFGKGAAGPLVGKIWEHSFATAFIARELSVRVGFSQPTDAYVAGLMHDLGLLVEARCLPAELRKVVAAAEEQGGWDPALEARELGTDHRSVGAILAQKWDFPGAIVDCIRDHHDPPEDSPLAAIVYVADHCADAGGLGLVEAEIDPDFDLLSCCRGVPGLVNKLPLPDGLHFLESTEDWASQVRFLVSQFIIPK